MDNINGTTWTFLIVGGGSGSRIGGCPKQFRFLGDIPVWKWSALLAERLSSYCPVTEIVLVVPDSYCSDINKDLKSTLPIKCVVGGNTRAESVMNGLKICSGSHVLVHDAARPFVTEELCVDLMRASARGEGVIPVIGSVDSLKQITNETISSLDRSKIYRAQTPQAYERAPLMQALANFGEGATDDAAAWLLAGNKLSYIVGSEDNFKITTKSDWERAIFTAGGRRTQRTGHGYDIHKLVKGRRLVLAGIEISGAELGLLGHSDADLVTHTVMDAMLGAAGEPDIGTLFPASDVKWKDADSMDLLKTVVAMLDDKGWICDWVDITLIAQKPRLGHMVDDFKNSLMRYLRRDGADVNVNIKIKSGEECGSVGRSECMVCHAVATLSRIVYFK